MDAAITNSRVNGPQPQRAAHLDDQTNTSNNESSVRKYIRYAVLAALGITGLGGVVAYFSPNHRWTGIGVAAFGGAAAALLHWWSGTDESNSPIAPVENIKPPKVLDIESFKKDLGNTALETFDRIKERDIKQFKDKFSEYKKDDILKWTKEILTVENLKGEIDYSKQKLVRAALLAYVINEGPTQQLLSLITNAEIKKEIKENIIDILVIKNRFLQKDSSVLSLIRDNKTYFPDKLAIANPETHLASSIAIHLQNDSPVMDAVFDRLRSNDKNDSSFRYSMTYFLMDNLTNKSSPFLIHAFEKFDINSSVSEAIKLRLVENTPKDKSIVEGFLKVLEKHNANGNEIILKRRSGDVSVLEHIRTQARVLGIDVDKIKAEVVNQGHIDVPIPGKKTDSPNSEPKKVVVPSELKERLAIVVDKTKDPELREATAEALVLDRYQGLNQTNTNDEVPKLLMDCFTNKDTHAVKGILKGLQLAHDIHNIPNIGLGEVEYLAKELSAFHSILNTSGVRQQFQGAESHLSSASSNLEGILQQYSKAVIGETENKLKKEATFVEGINELKDICNNKTDTDSLFYVKEKKKFAYQSLVNCSQAYSSWSVKERQQIAKLLEEIKTPETISPADSIMKPLRNNTMDIDIRKSFIDVNVALYPEHHPKTRELFIELIRCASDKKEPEEIRLKTVEALKELVNKWHFGKIDNQYGSQMAQAPIVLLKEVDYDSTLPPYSLKNILEDSSASKELRASTVELLESICEKQKAHIGEEPKEAREIREILKQYHASNPVSTGDLQVGEKKTIEYKNPIQIGNSSLHLCHYDHLPEDLKDLVDSTMEYFIIDSSRIGIKPDKHVTLGGAYKPITTPYKALRGIETLKIEDLLSSRFSPDAGVGVENIVISRSGNNICFEASQASNRVINPDLVYKGRPLILMDGQINGGVFLGAGGEAIVVDKHSPNLIPLYMQAKGILQKGLSTEESLKAIYALVKQRVKVNPNINEDLQARDWRGDRKVSIDHFIEHGGICRHFALIYGSIIERAIEEGLLKGKVSIDANYIPQKQGHAWCRYTDESETPWILDGTQNYCGKLSDYNYTESGWIYARPGEGKDDLLKQEGVKWDTPQYMQTLLKAINHFDSLSNNSPTNDLGWQKWTGELLGLMKGDVINVRPSVFNLIASLDADKKDKIQSCLIEQLSSQDNENITSSIYLLSTARHEPALDKIINCSNSNELDIRFEATLGLGNFKNIKSAKALVDRLLKEDSEVLALFIPLALTSIGEPAVEALLPILETTNTSVNIEAKESLLPFIQLITIRNPKCIQKLEEALNTRSFDPKIREKIQDLIKPKSQSE